MPKVAFATCHPMPEPDVDEPVLLEACASAGINAHLVPWQDATVDWSAFDLVVPRSTWDYYLHEATFREWICAADGQTKLLNPAKSMLDNIDKRYLACLAEAGVPVVPTRFIEHGTKLERLFEWPEIVIKPTVSAASFLTRRFSHDQVQEAFAFLARVLERGPAMIQPYLSRVAEGGEIALVHIDGEFTHGIVKHPRFEDGVESVSETAVDCSVEQRAIAEKVMQTVPPGWLYARVDLMQSDRGEWLLSELELIEPSLFFLQSQPALNRFVSALLKRTNGASA